MENSRPSSKYTVSRLYITNLDSLRAIVEINDMYLQLRQQYIIDEPPYHVTLLAGKLVMH